ncbi:sperm motility kinase Y-like [Dipodomys merriami]|uniref:sperm motility kinase Y-like n=1 Tax=Dipodomys merriami TaxID=94247 RepID=UPI003855F569
MTSESREARSQQGLEASSSDEELLRDHYQVLRTIRHGGFALIKLAKHLLTDTLVEVKVLNKKENPFFATEVDIFKSLDHPNVVKLLEIIETEQWLYFVMEYLEGGDLVDYLQEAGRMEEEEARPLFKQILSAVKYCHDNRIAHRHIKLENILLDQKGKAKLCDFGVSTRFTPGEELDCECGTVSLWPPELFLHQKYQGPKMDVWSLGIEVYCIVMGKLPFRRESSANLKRQVLNGPFPIRKTFSQELRGLFAFLLTAKIEQRPSLGQVMKHPWFRKTEPFAPTPSQTVSKEPDPAISDITYDLGYDSSEV